MNFIYGKGGVERVGFPPVLHPLTVGPFIIQLPYHGGGFGRPFTVKGKGVGLIHPVAVVPGDYVILIYGPAADALNKPLPDSRTVLSLPQGMRTIVPTVKVPYNRDRKSTRLNSSHSS